MEHKSISIADQIFEQLEQNILAGQYERGEMLSEAGLARELGVSRTPVREAIRRLEQEDFLEESSRGIAVVGITYEDMMDMYEIRSQIEGLAARRAAERIDEETLRKMKDTLELQRFYCEKGGENSAEQIRNLDSEFHRLLYYAADSRSYYNTLCSLHKRMTKFRKASVSKKSRAMQALEEHEAIREALAAHDPNAAEAAALRHVLSAQNRMKEMEC